MREWRGMMRYLLDLKTGSALSMSCSLEIVSQPGRNTRMAPGSDPRQIILINSSIRSMPILSWSILRNASMTWGGNFRCFSREVM